MLIFPFSKLDHKFLDGKNTITATHTKKWNEALKLMRMTFKSYVGYVADTLTL